MSIVSERRDRAGLCNAVYIEWLSRLVKHFGDFRWRDGISYAEPGKAMDFRECTEHNDVSLVPNKLKRVRRIIEEFEIRLVEDDNDVIRHSRHETLDRALRNQRTGRIVWIRNENDSGL